MSDGRYPDILRQAGFQLIGTLEYRVRISSWWHPGSDHLMQVLLVTIGDAVLIKADKTYYMKSVGESGETWARDISLLHDWLEAHLPEVRISFSHFRDVPRELAEAEARRCLGASSPAEPLATEEDISRLQRDLGRKQDQLRSDEAMAAMYSGPPDALSAYLHHRGRGQQADVQRLELLLQQRQQRLGVLQHLQREYLRKGSAAVYAMSFSSNVQWAGNEAEFRDALAAVVKEIRDQHRHQILQKLQGGRLNIQLAEADEPVVAWIEQWLGGSLSPRQLERLLPTAPLRSALQNHTMVTPDEPILVDGHVRAAEKRVGARVVSDVLGRLDVTEAQGRQHVDAARFAAEKMPMHVGFRTNERGDLLGPAVLPLAEVVHGSISGTTGSGKSFFARVLVEEACLHQGLSVLVLDPRNQFAGLLVPEDRPEILRQYEALGMQAKQARGFAFEYFAAANPGDLALIDPAALAKGRSIVSFKGLDDRRRCDLAADVLMGVFDAASGTESDRPRLLILIDEAQLLIRRRVDDDAKDAAARSELAIDRIAREGRKYGIVMILVSQSMKDFSHELANVRQMASTKIFLRNSDRELDYAADFVGDGRLLVNLPTGTALVHNAAWGLERVRVRLPLSKVCELPEAQLRALRDRPELRSAQEISSEARALLKVIRQSSVAGEPVNMSRVATLAAITSKRRLQQLVQELEEARVISTRTLAERGKPRVIEPVG